MRHRSVVLSCLILLGIWLIVCNGFGAVDAPETSCEVRTISNGILLPGDWLRLAWNGLFGPNRMSIPDCGALQSGDSEWLSASIQHVEIPQHPYMAANRGNNMHCDSSMSDAYGAPGPVRSDAVVSSRSQGFGGYGTVAFDARGRIVAVYSNGRRFQLELMDPYTLEELASRDLPARPWYWFLTGILPWEYIGAGMYFYLDDHDRAVVPTTENTILVLQTPEHGNRFELVRKYDLQDYVADLPWPRRDSVAWVLPDWSGEAYWFATTEGIVGTVDVDTAEVHTLRLDGEIIENSFAVDETGVYILSDYALYRFLRDASGDIVRDWRTPYDRGPRKKPGHITRGSGTSVSLVGDANGLVLVTDNAVPQIHLLAIRRDNGDIVCSAPLFEEGKSGTDISTACFEHADEQGQGTGVYSVLIENNWGHHAFPRSRPVSGLVRIDIRRQDDGTYTSEQIWESVQKSIGVFKLSLGSGLVYMYWRSESCPLTTWFLARVDFATGAVVGRTKVGTGLGYNNWAGALFLHPDGGTAYATTIFGLVMVRDPQL